MKPREITPKMKKDVGLAVMHMQGVAPEEEIKRTKMDLFFALLHPENPRVPWAKGNASRVTLLSVYDLEEYL
jgi:hypothetical protein